MKFVRGKRQFKQERMWGFILVAEPLAGVKTFGLIFGRSVWGIQWKIPRARPSSGSASTSRKSSRNTASK